jgi:hypothetical protein
MAFPASIFFTIRYARSTVHSLLFRLGFFLLLLYHLNSLQEDFSFIPGFVLGRIGRLQRLQIGTSESHRCEEPTQKRDKNRRGVLTMGPKARRAEEGSDGVGRGGSGEVTNGSEDGHLSTLTLSGRAGRARSDGGGGCRHGSGWRHSGVPSRRTLRFGFSLHRRGREWGHNNVRAFFTIIIWITERQKRCQPNTWIRGGDILKNLSQEKKIIITLFFFTHQS